MNAIPDGISPDQLKFFLDIVEWLPSEMNPRDAASYALWMSDINVGNLLQDSRSLSFLVRNSTNREVAEMLCIWSFTFKRYGVEPYLTTYGESHRESIS